MGVRLVDDGNRTVMYDSVSGIAFGPVMSSPDQAARFFDYLGEDPRRFTEASLSKHWGLFVKDDEDA